MDKEKVVINKSVKEDKFFIIYCVKFDDGSDHYYKESKFIKSAARIPRLDEFTKFAKKGDKFKDEDSEDK